MRVYQISIILSTISFFLLIGCKPVYFNYEVKEMDFVNRDRDTITLNQIDYYPIGANKICSFDDFVFFITRNDPAGQLKIYDIDKGHEISSICYQGKANNEIIDPYFVEEQIYQRGESVLMPIIDNKVVLKEIDITKSLLKGSAVVNAHTTCISPLDGSFALIDNDIKKQFVYTNPVLSNGECGLPGFYISEEGKKEIRIPVYKELMQGSNRMDVFSQYLGRVYKNPSKNILIQPLQSLNYILFFDLDKEYYFAIHQDGTRRFEDKIPSNFNDDPTSLCFGDVAVSDDYFFVLYFARCGIEEDSDIKTEILRFDWNGNYIDGFSLNKEIHRISFNEKRNRLYCINISEEKLYQINLKRCN